MAPVKLSFAAPSSTRTCRKSVFSSRWTPRVESILPPMAVNVFIVSGIAKVPIGTVYKGVYPYLVGMSICLLILLVFPGISLWLPNLLMK